MGRPFERFSTVGHIWFRHYNVNMRLEVAIQPLSFFLRIAIVVWGICLVVNQPATAQRLSAVGSPLVTTRAADASKATAVALPTAPAPPREHAFWDRTNIALFSGIAVTRGMDYASTRNFQARGREEILLPDDVVNNSAGFASLEAAATLTSVGISYLLHRTGHHSLERWLSIGHISVTGFGDVRNYALESRHPAQ
jgi:hypothetical protein